ncbi:unnamed protein product [Adineta ricciae]|uniref:Uncharacterized protein n=1 Tax=Adineta ricciae TaxID=249248 RepID=A0A814BW76_ADIRI|nr:unnamed protein product [Adineta ricciae]
MGGLLSAATHPLSKYRHGNKPYAIVTGATYGIGRGLVFELARNNFNVVIHGRNPEKLHNVQREIIDLYPTISVQIAILDAAENTLSDAITNVVKELHVTILINFLGILGDGGFKPFEDYTDDSI